MITNYFNVAFRHARRHKGYTLISMLGLSVGLGCCLLISIYILHETSFDHYHENEQTIYRVAENIVRTDETVASASSAAPVGPRLAQEFPEIVGSVRFKRASMMMEYKDKRFQEESIFFTDPAVFTIFSYPLRNGNPTTALAFPRSIALSASAALKYFGNDDPIGRSLVIDSDEPFIVTAVFEDVPANSHLRFDFLLSFSTMESQGPGSAEGWEWAAYTYILLDPTANASDLDVKFKDFMKRQHDDGLLKKGQHRELVLQPLKDLYLHSRRVGEPSSGSVAQLYLFGFVGVFVLLIACINFVNLTTSQAAQRAKEVGIRKVVGGTRRQLNLQFLMETGLLTAGASLLAIVISSVLLPAFNDIMGSTLSAATLTDPFFIGTFIAISVVVGLTAGSYPSLVLSGFQPAGALRGSSGGRVRGNAVRKVLIIFQFSVSIIFIAGTMAVFSQLRFMQQQEPGYRREHVLVLAFGDDDVVQQNMETIKAELQRSPYINQAAASSHVPGKTIGSRQFDAKYADGVLRPVDMHLMAVDDDFINTYNIGIAAGRPFSSAYGTDASHSFIVNETATRKLGYRRPSEAIDQTLILDGQAGTIVGVVRDFHYASLHQHIEAMAMRMRTRSLSYLSLPLQPGTASAALDDFEDRWRLLAPHRPFDYFFLDEEFDSQYRADRQFGKVFGAAALIAILLACVGLVGLVAFTVHRRTKEIGIRKVLGASVSSVTLLLSANFIKLILISIAIATPLSWYILHRWLRDFAYHIEVSWHLFFFPGLLTVVVALISVSFQAVKASLMNPVTSLRNE